MQPAEFELTDGAFSLRGGTGPRVRLRNLQDFTSLSGAVLISSLTVNGVEVAGNRLSLPELGPAETGEFSLGLTGTQDDEINSGETILTVRLRTASATELLPADHELAWEQWFLASGKRVSPGTQDWLGLAGTPIANYLGVTKEDDPSGGNPKGLTLRLSGQVPQLFLGQGATATGPRLILWRAPTQNDLIRDMPGQENKAGYKWIDAGLNRLEEEWSCRDSGHGGIELTSVYRFRGSERGKCVVHLGEPDAEGWQPLRYEIAIPEELVDLPRVGLRFDLPGSYTDLAWYGRGPQESYPDRANGYAVALYRGSVSEQYVPYIVPQEHGGHSDTRWIGLYSEATAAGTLEVAADSGQTVHFSALRHAPEDLAAVRHTCDLVERNETILIIDFYHRGIGTAACGPDCPPHHVRGGGNYSGTIYLRG